VLAFLHTAPFSPVEALSSDRDQPVKIDADWAESDDKSGVAVYKGKVVLIQGSIRITGDVVTMYFDDDHNLERLIAVGKLARFRQRPDGEDVYQRAKAERIQYNLLNDTMVLTGRSVLAKGEDSIRATRIVYDTLNARIKGESKPKVRTAAKPKLRPRSGRVHITIKPKKRCADGTRRTKCP